MFVARARPASLVGIASRDRRGGDGNVDGTSLGSAVERHLAGRLVEAANDRRQAEIIDAEMGECVRPIERDGLRSRVGENRQGSEEQCDEAFRYRILL